MATPTNFNGSNDVLRAPEGWDKSQCLDLNVFRGNANLGGEPPIITSLILSAWELTDEELKEINRTKKVFLGCVGTKSQPPIYVTGFNPIGQEPSKSLIIT